MRLYLHRALFTRVIFALATATSRARTMGQVDVKTAMRYRHPETGQVSDMMNARNAQRKSATIGEASQRERPNDSIQKGS